jgi:hemerythrin
MDYFLAEVQGIGFHLCSDKLLTIIPWLFENRYSSEEAFMLANEYPTYEDRKAIHQDLTHKVVALSEKFEQETKFLRIEVSKFLTQWLIHHIKGEDQKMIKFFRNRLLSPQGTTQQ